MKKILLVLVSCLLIACMAGSAMASPAEMTIIGDPISFHPDSTGSATVVVYKIDYSSSQSSQRSITLDTSNSDVQARVILGSGSNTLTSPWTTSDAPEIVRTYNPNDYKDANGDVRYTLEVKGTKAGEIKITDKFANVDDNGVTDEATATPKANIPEFPTVALPIASVIGLLFVFGRKKEGL